MRRLDDETTGAEATRTTAREVVVAALGICRRRAGTLAAIGIVVFAPLAVLEALAAVFIHHRIDGDGEAQGLALGAFLGMSMLMLGSALCAGLIDTLVGHEFGEEDLGLRRAVRTLPYGRLIGVDVVQSLVIGATALLGFVPGLFAFTFTCLGGSLVMIEQLPVRAALRRSVELTRRRLGLTLLVVSLPVAVEHQVMHALAAWIGLSLASAWLVHAVAAVVVLVPVVVVEVTLAHHLRRDERPV